MYAISTWGRTKRKKELTPTCDARSGVTRGGKEEDMGPPRNSGLLSCARFRLRQTQPVHVRKKTVVVRKGNGTASPEGRKRKKGRKELDLTSVGRDAPTVCGGESTTNGWGEWRAGVRPKKGMKKNLRIRHI